MCTAAPIPPIIGAKGKNKGVRDANKEVTGAKVAASEPINCNTFGNISSASFGLPNAAFFIPAPIWLYISSN